MTLRDEVAALIEDGKWIMPLNRRLGAADRILALPQIKEALGKARLYDIQDTALNRSFREAPGQ